MGGAQSKSVYGTGRPNLEARFERLEIDNAPREQTLERSSDFSEKQEHGGQSEHIQCFVQHDMEEKDR